VSDTQTSETTHVGVAVIGGGLAGLATAIRLRERGWDDFLVLERGDRVGGTWRDNDYPGATCDVASHLYSYSFALNPEWSRSFSGQGEIQRYIEDVTARYRLQARQLFGCEVLSATWLDDAARWELKTSRGPITADILIGAYGALCEPALPDIEGIDSFAGPIFHSARWSHDVDLTGKRVAVIGTGASAIQIVPAIADRVGRLEVYQRTAPWIVYKLDRRYTAPERFAFRHVPGYQRLARNAIFWMQEAQVVGMTRMPRMLKPLELLARAKLRREVRDPALRRRLTPNYNFGCKRILLSNDYLPVFNRHNVHLITDDITEVRGNTIVTADHTEHETDAIVLATGFRVTDSPMHQIIFGRNGRSLQDVFDDVGRQCYKGTAISGFPNMFLLLGPNTGLGHNSIIYMIEAQVNYVVDAVATIRRGGYRTVEVRREAQERYSRTLQRKLSRSVWNTGGCTSWYLDKHGANTTMWPGFSFQFRRLTKSFDADAFHCRPDRSRSTCSDKGQ
jgi:cation diffusion facilitator CzcD-associated flavoprotein CzcO